jgi:hypothetical protein
MKLKNCSLRIGICSDWLYARILRAVLCGRWLCGHCYLAQRRRGAEFFDDGFTPGLSTTNRGINPLATVFAVRLGICSDWLYARTLRAVLYGRWLYGHCDLAQRRRVFLAMALALLPLGGMTSVSSGTATVFASEHLGGMTSVSSGTAAGEADMTNSP